MPSQIDFVVAVGMFFTFIALLLVYLMTYFSSYSSFMATSELRSSANEITESLVSSEGLPEDWENFSYTPVSIGLITDLYRVPIKVTDTNDTAWNNVTINISYSFDTKCENKAWNETVRLYNASSAMVPITLYNQTFCSQQYLNESDIVFNVTLARNQSKMFYLYFSGDDEILPATYSSIVFTNVTNYTVKYYPEENLPALSVAKLKALKNLPYAEVARTLGTNYNFYLEVGGI